MTDVACQACVVACLLEDVVDERRRGGLAVRTGNTNHLGIGIATSKLYLADDVDTLLLDLDNHRSRIGNTRTLDDFVSIKNLLLGMLSFFPGYLTIVQHLLVFVGNLGHIADKHIESLFLGQNGCSSTTLTCS